MFLSVALRAFLIATYCHLMPRWGEKPGFFSEKRWIFKAKHEIIGEKVRDYRRKNIKKERK